MIHDIQIYYGAENEFAGFLPDGFCYSGEQVPNSANNLTNSIHFLLQRTVYAACFQSMHQNQ